MTGTPALDTLAVEARRHLAERWDAFGPATHPVDRAPAAAWQAAEAVVTHPWDGSIPDPDRADPVDAPDARLQLLLDAFRELRDVVAAGGCDGLVARQAVGAVYAEGSLLAQLVDEAGDEVVDAAALRVMLTGMYRALGAFLVGRAGGLLEDARALEAGVTVADEGSR